MSKDIEPQGKTTDKEHTLSLGNYLQRERHKKKLSIREIHLATKVPEEALNALEEGNKKQLPVTVFTKGFVKIYGQYLGLNQNDILNRFQKEWVTDTDNDSPEMLREESMAQISPFYLSFQFYFVIIAITTLLGLAYFFFNASDNKSQDLSLKNVREMPTLPPSIITKHDRISISQLHPDLPPSTQALISPKSAGKIAKEEDNNDIILAELPFVRLLRDEDAVQLNTGSNQQSYPANRATQPPVLLPPQHLANKQPFDVDKEQFVEELLPEDIDDSVPLDLHIAFLARTRISISQDDKRPSKYIFSTGEESTWTADKTISMQIEKTENIRITLNGKIVSLPESQGTPLAITLPADLHKL
jgi:cytoskeletal protein RodZ